MSGPARADGGRAFPCVASIGPELGMTLRDYFAAKALPVSYAMAEMCYRESPAPETVASWAYELADAMLVARAP